MNSQGAIPKSQASAPIATTAQSTNPIKIYLEKALQVIENCIEAGEKMVKSCEKIYETPALEAIVKRLREDTNAIVEMREKILKIKRSVTLGNQEIIKSDLQSMISGMKNVSDERIHMLSDVVSNMFCLTEASRVKKNFEATDKELNDMEQHLFPNERLKQFARTLRVRNNMVVQSLGQTENMLQELLKKMGMRTPDRRQPAAPQLPLEQPKAAATEELLIAGLDEPSWLKPYQPPQKVVREITEDLMSFYINPELKLNDIKMATTEPEHVTRIHQEKVPQRPTTPREIPQSRIPRTSYKSTSQSGDLKLRERVLMTPKPVTSHSTAAHSSLNQGLKFERVPSRTPEDFPVGNSLKKRMN